MELIKMKEQVISKYGKDSFEAGYIQYVFSKRPTNYFIFVYHQLMGA